jgi:hypothetical protein
MIGTLRFIRGNRHADATRGINRIKVEVVPLTDLPSRGCYGMDNGLAVYSTSEGTFLASSRDESALKETGLFNRGANVPFSGGPVGLYLARELRGLNDGISDEQRVQGFQAILKSENATRNHGILYFPA